MSRNLQVSGFAAIARDIAVDCKPTANREVFAIRNARRSASFFDRLNAWLAS